MQAHSFGVFAAAVALPACVASPDRELWPPPPGEPGIRIDVAFHDWHTIVVESVAGGFREWEYGEKAWFLEGKQGISGVFRALFWPTTAAVGAAATSRPVWERHPEGETRRWTFVLSERGLEAMRKALEAEAGEPLPDFPAWRRGRHDYHLFHGCHHFTAKALDAAGLPITPWWCFSGGLIGLQLDRIARFHREEGLAVGTLAPARRTPLRGCRGSCALRR